MCKPARSEQLAAPEEEAAYHAQAEEFFKSTAPKRAAKPPRSEISDDEEAQSYNLPSEDLNDAERRNLAALNSDPTPIVHPPVEDLEEYHVSEYYSKYNIGEKHCPTGDAFIKLDARMASPVKLAGHARPYHDNTFIRSPSKTNPARDDWGTMVEQAVN